MNKYPYFSENKFDTKIIYNSSKYGGAEFLEAYLKNRKDLLKSIKQNLVWSELYANSNDKISANIIKHLKDNNRILNSDIIYNQKINTNDTLIYIFYQLSQNRNDIDDKTIYNLLSQFIKRYEVTKKLYEFYDKDFRNPEGDYNKTDNYLFLSLNSYLFYKRRYNLKFINVILKINDVFCSELIVSDDLSSNLLFLSITYELEAVKELYKANGVKL